VSDSDVGAQRPPSLRDVGFESLPELFDTVLDRSGTGVMVFDDQLCLAYVNEVAARVGGYPVDVHVGRRLAELHPQIAAQADTMLAEVLATQEAIRDQELVWEQPRPPHHRRYWMVSYVPLRAVDGTAYVAAIYVETTPVRRAHERLAKLIDALPIFVGMCTPDGVIVEANAATLAAAQVDRQDLIGRPLWEASWWRGLSSSRRRISDAVVLAQEGRASRFDVRAQVGDEMVMLDFQLVPIVESGAVTALLPSALDISSRVADQARLQALAELSRALNGAVTVEQASRRVVAHGPSVIGATVASVALIDRERGVLRIDHGLPPEVAERGTVLPLGGSRTVWHEAIESGRTLVVDRATRRQRYPDAVADPRLAGIDTTAAVPLIDEAGEPFGAIGMGWAAPVEDVHQIRLRLQLLGDLCSDALRRAQRTETQNRFVRELQDEVLATPDVARRLDVALTYEPAQTDIGFGGDWYDVIEVGDSCTAVVVGDVAGHGISAAARMTEAKATIRALVLTVPHDEVIPAATRSLDHLESGYVATVAVAWIDTDGQCVEWRLAGHVPPVLRTPDGRARILTGAHHPPIGTPTEARTEEPVPFPPGSLLVLYTDGLVERRDEEIDVGMERLRAVVEALPAGCSAAEARDALLRELHVESSDDDVAIVVVRNL